MNTDQLISTDLNTFIEHLAKFDADACEWHARRIIDKLGSPTSFEKYLYELTGVAVKLDGPDEEKIMQYYRETKQLFPGISPDDDILGRLTSLMLQMMVKRLKKSLDKLR